ncbi:MAG: hypothetical protein KDB79_05265, partial [Acidobacteria bacterium]|nr:hypothetical protein [Acidobacteriota bacterium]
SYSFTAKDKSSKKILLEVFAKINGEDVKVAQAEKTFNIEAKDETDEKEDEKTAEAKPSPSSSPETEIENEPPKLMFGGTSSNIWDGTIGEVGFKLKRQSAVSKGTGECKWEATVNSQVWGTLDPFIGPRSQADITKKIQEFVAESKRWGKTTTVKSFSIGEFKGQFANSSVRFRGGGASVDAGYRSSSISAEGRGWLMKDGKAIEVGYNVTGGGCWENSDRAFLERQAYAAQDEAKGIINGLTLTGGGFSKTAYSGPKLDGSDMPTLELVATPNRTKLKKGEIVEVRAVVTNTNAEDEPIEFTWTGDHGGKGANVQFIAEKPGKQKLSVVAKGAKYQIGTAAIEFEIADLKAELKQLTPQTKVAVGTPVAFSAQLYSEGKPASGN